MRISLSNVPTAELPSTSAQKSRNCSRHEAIPTNPSVVPTAARQEEQSATGTVAIVTLVRCSRQYAPSVVRKQKFPLNPAKIDPYIAEHAT
jgi:hypothetical protein